MNWMIYDTNGFTGALMAREAQRRSLRPMLAGRNEAEVRRLAETLGLEWKAFALDDEAAVSAAIAGVKLVLHCAGATYSPPTSPPACRISRCTWP